MKQLSLLEKIEAEMQSDKNLVAPPVIEQPSNLTQCRFVCSVKGKPFLVTFEKKGYQYNIKSCDIQPKVGNSQETSGVADSVPQKMDIPFSQINFSNWCCPWCGDKTGEFAYFTCRNCGVVCAGSYHREKAKIKSLFTPLRHFFCHSCNSKHAFTVCSSGQESFLSTNRKSSFLKPDHTQNDLKRLIHQ